MAPVKEPVTESVEERSLVKKSLDGNIGAITLDNPPKHDALGAALIGEGRGPQTRAVDRGE